jgi:hypothetical protein
MQAGVITTPALLSVPSTPDLALARASERLAAIESETAALRADLAAARSALRSAGTPADPNQALSPVQVGAQMGLGRSAVHAMCASGRLGVAHGRRLPPRAAP